MRTFGIPSFIADVTCGYSTTPWKPLYGDILRSRGTVTAPKSEKQSQEEGDGVAKLGGHGKDEEMAGVSSTLFGNGCSYLYHNLRIIVQLASLKVML
jgi:hypothetical protein